MRARLQPDPDRDHVLGIGAGIEIDAAQGDQERVVDRQLARPHVLDEQRVRDHRVEAAVRAQPALAFAPGPVQMHPEQPLLGPPAADLGPADLAATALAIEYPGTDQAVFGRHGWVLHCTSPPDEPGHSSARAARWPRQLWASMNTRRISG